MTSSIKTVELAGEWVVRTSNGLVGAGQRLSRSQAARIAAHLRRESTADCRGRDCVRRTVTDSK